MQKTFLAIGIASTVASCIPYSQYREKEPQIDKYTFGLSIKGKKQLEKLNPMLEEISGERTMSVDAINFSSEPSVFCGSQSNGCMRGLDMVLDKRDLDANKRTEDKLSFANIKLIGTYFHEQGHFMAKMRLIKYITTKQQVFHELEATLFEATAAKKFGEEHDLWLGLAIFENAFGQYRYNKHKEYTQLQSVDEILEKFKKLQPNQAPRHAVARMLMHLSIIGFDYDIEKAYEFVHKSSNDDLEARLNKILSRKSKPSMAESEGDMDTTPSHNATAWERVYLWATKVFCSNAETAQLECFRRIPEMKMYPEIDQLFSNTVTGLKTEKTQENWTMLRNLQGTNIIKAYNSKLFVIAELADDEIVSAKIYWRDRDYTKFDLSYDKSMDGKRRSVTLERNTSRSTGNFTWADLKSSIFEGSATGGGTTTVIEENKEKEKFDYFYAQIKQIIGRIR